MPNHRSNRTCSVEGCDRIHCARGMCRPHYHRWHQGIPLDAPPPKRLGSVCDVVGCDRKPDARGPRLCSGHYQRLAKYGDVHADRPLGRWSQGTKSWIDANGYERVWRDGRPVGVHRLVMERTLGRQLIPGETVHHKNGLTADNRPENLELWVSWQRFGQRVEDLIEFVANNYPEDRKSVV